MLTDIQMFNKSLELISIYFKDKKDRGGNPYNLHCLYVMYNVKQYGLQAMIIGLLHDIIEDTEMTKEGLINLGFSFDIVQRVYVLTHKEEESYDQYIKDIFTDEICTKIKLADLRHNLDITRLKKITKKDFDRLEKYHKAYKYLSRVK